MGYRVRFWPDVVVVVLCIGMPILGLPLLGFLLMKNPNRIWLCALGLVIWLIPAAALSMVGYFFGAVLAQGEPGIAVSFAIPGFVLGAVGVLIFGIRLGLLIRGRSGKREAMVTATRPKG